MECADVRKRLKEYAGGAIQDPGERLRMEEHIKTCPVCKRELLMWQEVLDKQRVVSRMQSGLPKELKDRIKYRMAKNLKQPDLPPSIKKIQSFAKGRGALIIVYLLTCAALLFLSRTVKFKNPVLEPMLFFTGFAILFLLLLFKDNNKSK